MEGPRIAGLAVEVEETPVKEDSWPFKLLLYPLFSRSRQAVLKGQTTGSIPLLRALTKRVSAS